MTPATNTRIGNPALNNVQSPLIAIVIPLYNHAVTLEKVVAESFRFTDILIVVDDGSSDNATEVLERLDPAVHVIRHPQNLGKGTAILSGAKKARELNATHIITIDADGQHFSDDIPGFIKAVIENPEAIIVGCRDFAATYVPKSSDFGRDFSNFWFRVQTGRKIGDSQSGFRAYPLNLLEALNWREKRYAFENEVLVRAAWAGVKINEIRIGVYYPAKHEHISHFHRLWDNLRLSFLNTRLTIRSMLPWPHNQLDRDGEPPSEPVSILHPVSSLKLLLKENASPKRLALAVGLGVLVGALPLLGMRAMIILMITGYFRLNKIVALAAGNICMPPFVPALCIEVGYFIRHGAWLTEISFKTLGYQALERFWEWGLGSLIIGPLLALFFGLLTLIMAKKINDRKDSTNC
jgi:glycosyltransferase involved in cell wall biosynthesis